MKRCRHTNSVEISDGPTWLAEGPGKAGRVVDIRRRMCFDCGEWTLMGPSNDDDERVRVEMRAAHLAHGENNEHEFTQIEWCGWSEDEIAIDGDTGEVVDVTTEWRWHAGYLARQIATHGDDE